MNKKQPSNKKTYIDSETGRKVNDYIPSYISSKPWYYNENDKTLQVDKNSRKRKSNDEMYKKIVDKSSDRLKHQRITDKPFTNDPTPGNGIHDILEEVHDSTPSKISSKIWLKKGLCGNCGGKHNKIDCLEKPHSEKFKNIQNSTSNVIFTKKDINDWDIKRDKWRDFDTNEEYNEIVNNLKRKNQSIQNNPLEIKETDVNILSRDITDKPKYLEVIKTGEELRYNPKSRVYKDLKEGYLNERGQFIPYLTGEAAEFEQLKKFSKLKNDPKTIPILAPTTTMLKLKEKKKSDKLLSSQIAKKIHDKYT